MPRSIRSPHTVQRTACALRTLLLLCSTALPLCLLAQETQPETAPPSIVYSSREFLLPYGPAMPPGLDTIEVRAMLPGPHPLAILTHGTSDKPEERAQVTPWGQLNQAIWFARRGFVVLVVVRRGYGRSGGEQDSRRGGCGRNGSFEEAGEASAEDLRAAARYAAKLPEVDASTIVSAGVSTGGFAQAALSADPMPGLKAAINFAGGRGGDGKGHNCDFEGLQAAYRAFGRHSKVPMLWLYAENDKWFPPEMARRFDAAFQKGGGEVQFLLVPPDGEDGHHFYSHVEKWSPVVEAFLRDKGLLPLGDNVLPPPALPNVPPPAGLSEHGIDAFHHFLAAGPYKAFATNGAEFFGYSTGQFTQDLADDKALEHCKAATRGQGRCTIVMRTPHESPAAH